MALDSTPWFIGGGAEHSPEVARMLLYIATGGAEGVIEPKSLHGKQTAVPGPNIRVAPGGGVMVSRYPGAAQQSYGGRNITQTEVPITATGSGGGRTDLVVLRVVDPQYEGQAPEDPNAFDYSRLEVIEGVSAGIKSARDLNLAYPAIALLKVTLPKSTATVTNAMITDLREVAQPREKTVRRARQIHRGDPGQVLRSSKETGEVFPNVGQQSIYVPEWATRALVSTDWTMVRTEANKNPFGHYWVEYGPWVSGSDWERSTERNGFNSGTIGDAHYGNWLLRSEVYIPAAYRGTKISFVPKAKYTGAHQGISVNPLSGMNMDVTFLEVADPSTS